MTGKLATMLKMICLVLFLGSMVVWIATPTETYKYKWTPKLANKLNPTYIGGQGINLFLLTFPMMIIAALGCIYVHIKMKKDSSSPSFMSRKQHLTLFKRPLLVMGPFGLITVTELMFSAMFMAVVVWSFANYYYVSVKHPFMMHRKPEELWQTRFRSVSLRLGYASNFAWAFVFTPVTRLNSLLPLLGLTSESSIKYHIWIGQVVMVLSALHSVGFFIYWLMTTQMAEALEWANDHVSNVAGEISWVFLLVMWATSFACTRRKMFELFFYTHYLYLLATFFYIVHIGVPWLCQILPGLFLFSVDRYLRFLQSHARARLISARLLHCGVIELNFAKSSGLDYNAPSDLFINVPKISKMQWHPFTVTSNANMETERLSIVIKTDGSWTNKLYKLLSSSCIDSLHVSVEGPYGPASTHFLRFTCKVFKRYKSLVLISGGSGFTPFIPIIKEIIHQSNNNQHGQVPSILLVCAFKHATDLAMLDLLLPIECQDASLSRIQIQIQAYVTQETEPTDPQRPMVQTMWFKPHPSESLVTPILGPSTWLSLCVVIVGSFVLFLVLLGLVTRYHIYPIDHNTDDIYNFTYWVLWDVFLVSVSIIIVSSVVFMMQKRKLRGEKQVQNVEMQSPSSSPGFWFHAGDHVESHAYHSLVQATHVHYGGRPDLKKLLSECKEENTGVMASGPRGIRHEVARICSFNSPKNLHYEYMSFNW